MYNAKAFDVTELSNTLSFQSQRDCLFVSGEQCIISSGIAERFNANINNTQELVLTLQQKLSKHADHSIAFGIVPFCKSEQAQFIIPKQVSRWEKTAFSAWLAAELSTEPLSKNILKNVHYLQNQQQFELAVKFSKELFSRQQLEKIVLSKQVDLTFDSTIHKEQLLSALLQQNQSGYHFSFPLADKAVLMGVSPELLLRKQGQQLMTNPLAGSIPRHICPDEEHKRKLALFSSTKERFEHAVVIEGMQQILAPFCSHLTVPNEPSLLSTATMWHLSTELMGTLQENDSHILSIANQLHPTPALCGKPTALAYSHIAAIEGHSRGFFSGIIGWCDKEGNGEWVVVIRCAQIQENLARLFAGAGIVSASEPTLEWQETEVKLNTMLNALGVQQHYSSFNKLAL